MGPLYTQESEVGKPRDDAQITPNQKQILVRLGSQEIGAAAEVLFPTTGLTCGALGSPPTEFFYVVEGQVQPQRVDREDGSLYWEIVDVDESQGAVDLTFWVSGGMPSSVEFGDLQIALDRLVAAGLIAARWLSLGANRRRCLRAVAGALAREEHGPDSIANFIDVVTILAGDRVGWAPAKMVDETSAMLRSGRKVLGWPALARILSDNTVENLKRLLRVEDAGQRLAVAEKIAEGLAEKAEGSGGPNEVINYIYQSADDLQALKALHAKKATAFEGLLRRLRSAGAKAKDIDALRRAVREEVKADLAKEQEHVDEREEEGLVKPLADNVSETNHFSQDQGGKLYIYSRGVYRPTGASYVRQRVKALLEEWGLPKYWSSRLAEEVIEYLRVDSPPLWESPPMTYLNVLNGLLNVETGVLERHSPDCLTTVQLPVIYDHTATCLAWDRFCSQVFPEDCWEFSWEVVAWLMLPYTSIQKALLLIGLGGNGKSVWMAALRAFLGRGNVSTIALQMLEQHRFAVAGLVGKLANICTDLPSQHLVGTSVFKGITGGDALTGEYKYKDIFDFTPFARLVFSANAPPASPDASSAFFDRWVVVPFERTFRGTDEEVPSHVLGAQLAQPGELSGVLNKALVALRNLRARGGFYVTESMRQATEEFRQLTDPVAVWLDRHTIENPEAMVVKQTLIREFNYTSMREGRSPISDKAFAQALRRVRPNIQDAQRTVEGRPGVRVWLGVGLRGH